MLQFVIRKARIADGEKISEIKIQTWRHTYKNLIADDILEKLPQKETAEKWTGILKSFENTDNKACFVAEYDNEVVGYCFGVMLEDKKWDLDLTAIYILPKYHGKGIGTKLISHTVSFLENANSMIVWILKDNSSEKFYQKLGGIYEETKIEKIGDTDYIAHGYVFDSETLEKLRLSTNK